MNMICMYIHTSPNKLLEWKLEIRKNFSEIFISCGINAMWPMHAQCYTKRSVFNNIPKNYNYGWAKWPSVHSYTKYSLLIEQPNWFLTYDLWQCSTTIRVLVWPKRGNYFINLGPRHYTFGKINSCEELFYPSQRLGEGSNLAVNHYGCYSRQTCLQYDTT